MKGDRGRARTVPLMARPVSVPAGEFYPAILDTVDEDLKATEKAKYKTNNPSCSNLIKLARLSSRSSAGLLIHFD